MDQNRSKRGPKGAPVQGFPRGPAATDGNNENVKPQISSGKPVPRQNEKSLQDSKKSEITSANPSGTAKGPQPTADQLRMANLFQGSQITDTVLQEKTLKVQELTSCTIDAAIVALHDCNNHVEEAVNLLLERGPESDEWEKIEKNGKPKKKAKSKKAEDEEDEDRPNVPFGMSGKRGGGGDRGRPSQRGGSSRGGKAPVQSTQRSATNSQDTVSNSVNGSRNQGTRDRPISPQNARGHPPGEGKTFEGQKGRPDEATWDDDDWKEEIRETKVFTRSSNTLPPANAFNAAASQPSQPAHGNTAGSGPSFSAMVQKQSAWSAPTVPVGGRQWENSESSNWRPPGSSAGSQKPPGTSSGAIPDSNLGVPASSGVPPSLPSANASQTSKPDISQLGTQLGSMVFNRSDVESPGDFSIPSQTQTFSSRNAFTDIASGGSLQSSLEFTPSRGSGVDSSSRQAAVASGPSLGSTELHRPQIGQGSGGSAFGPPSVQSQTFSSNQSTDGPMNTYSARNIQSSAFSQPLSSKPTAAYNDNTSFFGPPLQTSPPTLTQQGVLPGAGPSASSDARFGQAPPSLNVQKPQAVSPQNPVKFGGSAVGSASYPPPPTAQRVPPSNQNIGPLSSQTLLQSSQQGQQSQHQDLGQQLHHAQQQHPTPSPSKASATHSASYYGNAGGDATSRSTAFSAFSSTASGQGMGGGKEMPSGIQQQPQQSMQQPQQNMQQPSLSQSNQLSTTISPQRSTGASSTTPVYAASKPIPSVSNSKSPYGSQPSMTQSTMSQQPYLSQQGVYQQNPLQMFPQMGYGGMDAINDPRLVMPQGMTLDSSYQYAMSPRDPAGLSYSSNPDYNKYRNDPVLSSQQIQVSQQQQQQQQAMVTPHLSQYAGAYQVYSPPVAQSYQFPASQQMYSGMQSNYKSGTTMGSSYPGNNFGDMGGLTDVNKSSNAYLRSGASDSYGNPGMLSGGVDMNAAYGYGSKQTNKFEKPAQQYGMQLGSQQTQQYAQQQYFPMMQQPLHAMPQVQQGSTMSGQNLANNKQNKGPIPNHNQYWGNQ